MLNTLNAVSVMTNLVSYARYIMLYCPEKTVPLKANVL